MYEFKMPSLGAEMESGRLVEWKIKVGDHVKRGDIIAVVDTDKAAIEIEIWKSGIVKELILKPNEKVPVGTPMARIDLEDEVPVVPQVTVKPQKTLAIQKAIALVMESSKRQIPHYYIARRVKALDLQQWLKSENASHGIGEQILLIAPILKAIALACRQFPEMNGRFQNQEFIPSHEVNLNVVISLREGGLIAPAIVNTDQLSVQEIMKALMSLVERARSGSVRSSELSEGSITVTNLIESEAELVFGVIYPPQVAILGVTRVNEETLNLSLSGDHRVSDGHQASLFLKQINQLLEKPERL